MGNRGCLHRADRTLGVTRWRSKMWICCVLRWRDVKRDVMPPGRWTALFFLDEATALAAGHRPCGYCRRADYASFTGAWRRAAGLARPPRAGVMVRHNGTCGLLAAERFLPWTHRGYLDPVALGPATRVELLTPPSTVAVIAAGYRPMLHPSAGT